MLKFFINQSYLLVKEKYENVSSPEHIQEDSKYIANNFDKLSHDQIIELSKQHGSAVGYLMAVQVLPVNLD